MKKLNILLLIALIGLLGILVPQTSSAVDVTVSVEVPANTPDITITVKELTSAGQDPFTGTTVQAMNFGQLTHTLVGGADA
ncbi:MAG: hypothetical protein NT066_06410, partial [Candidatus Omnitrophica bacterium]|nr:hypothetical protein [Candidatus Omnitrophota bacterium]